MDRTRARAAGVPGRDVSVLDRPALHARSVGAAGAATAFGSLAGRGFRPSYRFSGLCFGGEVIPRHLQHSSEERRVGKEGGSSFRSRLSAFYLKKKTKKT